MEQGRWETGSRILLAPFVRSLLQITDPRFFFSSMKNTRSVIYSKDQKLA